MFNVIIRKGRVVDGAGNPWFLAGVGVKDGKILKMGNLKYGDTERAINA
jgi:N-acyl-D-amino-acid deacylase